MNDVARRWTACHSFPGTTIALWAVMLRHGGSALPAPEADTDAEARRTPARHGVGGFSLDQTRPGRRHASADTCSSSDARRTPLMMFLRRGRWFSVHALFTPFSFYALLFLMSLYYFIWLFYLIVLYYSNILFDFFFCYSNILFDFFFITQIFYLIFSLLLKYFIWFILLLLKYFIWFFLYYSNILFDWYDIFFSVF